MQDLETKDFGTGGNPSSGEPPRGRSRRKASAARKPLSPAFIRTRRILILCVLEVFVLGAIFAYSRILREYNKIQRPDFEVKNVENLELSTEDIQRMKGYWNIAAFGVDSRDSSVGRGNNSDVIIIVSINRETGEIRMASVFRDSYLSLSNGSYSKINSAYAIGGPEQAVRALNQNLDLNITDYVTFNWKAVATAVDILGGVDIDITSAEFKYINSYITETVKGTGIGSVHLKEPGMNHLDGVQAVAYARLRYMDDDYTRTERQRRVIQLCYDKAKNADMQTLSDLAGNMLSMVATSLTWEDGMSLAKNVRKYRIADTVGFPMKRKESVMGKKGACVLPDTLITNVQTLHAFLFGDNGYEVSRQVKEIDYKISADETNYKNSAAESKARQLEKAKEEEEKRKRKEEEEESKKAASEGESEETDENGNPIVKETDENGNTISTRPRDPLATDENGNPLYDLDESDEDGSPIAPGRTVETETDEDGNVIRVTHPGRGGISPTETLPASEEGDGRPSAPGGWGGSGTPGGRVSPTDGSDGSSGSGSGRTPTDEDGRRETTASFRDAPGQVTDSYVADGPGHSGSSGSKTTEADSPVSPAKTTEADSPVSPAKTTEADSPVSPAKTTEADSPAGPAKTTEADSPAPAKTTEADSPAPAKTTEAEDTRPTVSPASPTAAETAEASPGPGGPGGGGSETVAAFPGG